MSGLIELLDIRNGDAPLRTADVQAVTFSDERLVSVQEVSGYISLNGQRDVYVGEKDFLLSSLQPFQTEETLTIEMKDGGTIVIKVTDAAGDEFTV